MKKIFILCGSVVNINDIDQTKEKLEIRRKKKQTT